MITLDGNNATNTQLYGTTAFINLVGLVIVLTKYSIY